MPKALKSCPNGKKSPNLVILILTKVPVCGLPSWQATERSRLFNKAKHSLLWKAHRDLYGKAVISAQVTNALKFLSYHIRCQFQKLSREKRIRFLNSFFPKMYKAPNWKMKVQNFLLLNFELYLSKLMLYR